MNCLAPTPDLAARFRAFIFGLRDKVGTYYVRNRSAASLISLIGKRLTRRRVRFEALVARFEAGMLPPPRTEVPPPVEVPLPVEVPPPSEVPPAARPPRARAPDPVPRRRAYLLEIGQHEVATYTGYFEILMADPFMVALCEATPEAGRLLRPLWRMLSPRPLPAILRLPPRPPGPPRPKPVRVARPVPPPPPSPPPAAPRPYVQYIPGWGPLPGPG